MGTRLAALQARGCPQHYAAVPQLAQSTGTLALTFHLRSSAHKVLVQVVLHRPPSRLRFGFTGRAAEGSGGRKLSQMSLLLAGWRLLLLWRRHGLAGARPTRGVCVLR